MTKAVLALAFGIATAACGRTTTTATATDAAPSPVVAEPEPVMEVVDAGPPLRTITVSIATFERGSVLDECMNLDFTGHPHGDAGADPAKAIADRLLKKTEKGKESIRIKRPCAEQFPDHPALATCVLHQTVHPDDAGSADRAVALTITDSYHNLGTLGDDVYMKQCLQMDGDWQGIDKSSDTYREAVRTRLHRNAEDLQNQVRQMQQSLE